MGNISLIEKDIDSVEQKVKALIEDYKAGNISRQELLEKKETCYSDVFKDWYFCKTFSFVPISSNAPKREVFKDLSAQECRELVLRLRLAAGMPLEMFEEVPQGIEIPTNDTNDNWSTFEISEEELLNLEEIKLDTEYTFNFTPKNSKEKENFKVKFFYVADSEDPKTLSLVNIPSECYIDGATSLKQKRSYIECDAYRYTGSKAETYLLGTGCANGYEPFECIVTIKKRKAADQKLIAVLMPLKEDERWAKYYEWEKAHLEKIAQEENEWLESL